MFPSDWLIKISLTYGLTYDLILGLNTKDTLSTDVKIDEFFTLLERSFAVLKNHNKVVEQNIELGTRLETLEQKIIEIEKIINKNTPRADTPIRLGDDAPNFTGESTEGTIDFYEYLGNSWGILFSHPQDFTPICTTEIGQISKLKSEFDKRGVRVVALSVDTLESHREWIKDVEETQNCTVNFPLIADEDRKISLLYGMVHPEAKDAQTVRSVFVISPDKKIRLILTYPLSSGRNFEEILRAIDSLQLTKKYQLGTPANWRPGDDCLILPSVKTEEIPAKFPKGYKEIKPYYRTTPQPDLTGDTI